MKRIWISMLTLVFLTVSVAALMGAEKGGNSRKGKYTFRKSCRECHVEGGKAQELSPANKTQAQWDAVFAADKYKSLACKAEWEKLTPEDINDIYAYMWDHAFDSPSPAKCK